MTNPFTQDDLDNTSRCGLPQGRILQMLQSLNRIPNVKFTGDKATISPGESFPNAVPIIIEHARTTGTPIAFDFNGHTLTATVNSTPEGLWAQWNKEATRQRDEYHASDEYKESQRKSHEAALQKDKDRTEMEDIAPETLHLAHPELWNTWVMANTDGYGAATMDFAKRWARYMEACLRKGQTLKDCHERCSDLADVEGITGFMYGAAKQMLIQAWFHGQQLVDSVK